MKTLTEKQLLKGVITIQHAMIHLLNQHREFYSGFGPVTPQDDIYFGEGILELLRDTMHSVIADHKAVRAENMKRRRRRNRVAYQRTLRRLCPDFPDQSQQICA